MSYRWEGPANRAKNGTMANTIFPESPRVIYEHNYLEQVICQLRFPEILRIASEAPAAFQDLIRDRYPLIEKGTSIGLPPELAKLLPVNLNLTVDTSSYTFSSDDGRWKLQLSSDSISLTSTKYERWEEFSGHLRTALAAFVDVYTPAFFSRVGLRYQNIFLKGTETLENFKWSDLVNPRLAGILALSGVSEAVQSTSDRFVMKVNDNGDSVRVLHGVALHNPTNSKCYVIDLDFFNESKTEVANAGSKLAEYNQLAARLFRWCISDGLHESMRPRPIQE